MKYIVYTFLNMTRFVRSQDFISLPSFMFLSAVVSEIRELNGKKRWKKKKKKKKNLKIYSF